MAVANDDEIETMTAVANGIVDTFNALAKAIGPAAVTTVLQLVTAEVLNSYGITTERFAERVNVERGNLAADRARASQEEARRGG